jgi:membrane-associated phospholipid phosphatase
MAHPQSENCLKNVEDAAHQTAHAESAPAPVRQYRAWLFRAALILIAGGFAVLTFLVKTTPSFTIDLQITRAIQMISYSPFALLMSAISWPGFIPQSIIIAGLLIGLIYRLGLHWEAVMALIALAFSTATNVLVKDLISRPRPTPDLVIVNVPLNSYSFPSGHVMFYIGFFGFLGFLVFTLMKPSRKRSFFLILFGVPILLVGVSRIYLGEHWASDVLGAYLLGSLTLVVIIQFYLWGKTRFFVHQPAAAEPHQE